MIYIESVRRKGDVKSEENIDITIGDYRVIYSVQSGPAL